MWLRFRLWLGEILWFHFGLRSGQKKRAPTPEPVAELSYEMDREPGSGAKSRIHFDCEKASEPLFRKAPVSLKLCF